MLTKDKFNNSGISLITLVVTIIVIIIISAAVIMTLYGDNVFKNCSSLETVKISSNVTQIDGTAFNGCGKLKNIEIAEGNKNFRFENGILLGNEGKEMVIILENAIVNGILIIPDTVTSLKSSQIDQYSSNIVTINVPASVVSIEAEFFKSNNITNITIDSLNPKYKIYGKAMYTKEGV